VKRSTTLPLSSIVLLAGAAQAGLATLAGAQAPAAEAGGHVQYLPATQSAGRTIADMAASDIDRDGDVDVLTVDWNANLIHVLVNAGTHGFVQRQLTPEVSPRVLGLGDADSDGYPDLFVGFGSGLRWFCSADAGRFTLAGTLTFPGNDTAPVGLKLADVNGDGRLDVLIGLGSHSLGSRLGVAGGLWVALGDGRGGFRPLPTQKLLLRPASIVLADFDADGRIDVAELGSSRQPFISIAAGRGDGSFVDAGTCFPVSPEASGFACGDFDGDGDIDLATGTGSGVSIGRNVGARSFVVGPCLAAGGSVKGLAAGDLDQDGDVDLLVTSSAAAWIRLATNDARGHFTVTGNVPASNRCSQVLLADTSGDGYLDPWVGDVDTGKLFSGTSQGFVKR
jgi:FG-GAP-like repeat